MLQNLKRMPDAYALVKGNNEYADIRGNVYFYGVHGGTIVVAEIFGIPVQDNPPGGNFHGFHIHAGPSCTGTEADPFADADGHYNPENTNHPNHDGDLPPLLANDLMTWSAVYTKRFHPDDIIGRTIVIHEMPDDFMTQPSGNSGAMIACGEIVDHL